MNNDAGNITLAELGEFETIKRMTAGLSREGGIELGIGDDAAVYRIAEGRFLVVTADMLIEGIHFRRDWMEPFDIGWKSIAASLSDVAAMGAKPLYATVSVGFPVETKLYWAMELYRGMNEIARQHGLSIVGGDTVKSPLGVVVDVGMTGETSRYLKRSTARPGDIVAITGTPGYSRAGLLLLEAGRREPGLNGFLLAHRRPQPRVSEGQFISSMPQATAMIDVSDGLYGDIAHICEGSGVTVILDENLMPMPDEFMAICRSLDHDPLEVLLQGGEDYELLFTVAPDGWDDLQRAWQEKFSLPLTRIGETIVHRDACVLMRKRDGSVGPVRLQGFNHFKEK